MLKIKDMNLNNVIRQGDSQPRQYQLDTGNLYLNLTNKSATIRLMTADFQGIGYETTATVSSENKISFSIDDIIPAREYRLEVTVDDYVFPSRATDGQFNIDPSSHGQEVNIIQIIGKEEIVRDVKARVENELEPFLGGIEQAEAQRQSAFESNEQNREGTFTQAEIARQEAELDRQAQEDARETADLLRDDKIAQMEAEKDAVIANATVDSEVILARGGKPTLQARLDETTTQLEQKAKKDEVFLKEHGIDISEFNEQTRKTFLEAQGIDVNYVLGSGNVKPRNTSFFETGKNIFDKTNVILGKFVNQNTGALVDSATYNATAYIDVLPNTNYTVSVFYHGAFYDGDKNYISAIPDTTSGVSSETFETPANGHFIRLSLLPADMNTFQIEKGTSSTSYEPYRQTIEPNSIPDLEDGSITVNKTDFIRIGKNLFNKSTAIKGHYASSTNGRVLENDNYYASDFIEIEGDTKYIDTRNLYKAFYDKDKVFISGLSAGHEAPFTTPINARFLRITVLKNEIDSWQLEQNTIKTSYQPSGYFVDKNIYSSSESAGFPNQFIGITLPGTIPAVVGHEVNIYFENIVCVDNIENYQVNVVCSKGKHQTERWTYIPNEGDVGEHSLTIEIYKEFKLITTKTTKIKVASKSNKAGANPNVLIIGDSTTANGYTTTELNTLLSNDVMGVNLIGTQGTAPALHEGRSGWTTDRFYSSTDSPFVFDGTFNFAQYLSTNGLTTPDYVIINLGINDVFAANSDEEVLNIAENMVSQYDSMINNIKNVNPQTIFGVCVTIPSGNQDAFSAYGSGQTSWRYKLNNRLLAKHINDYYIAKTSRVYLVPINVCIDTVNNMAFDEETTINSRTEKTIKRQRNGVHPGVGGYEQIADMEFYWLKNNLSHG